MKRQTSRTLLIVYALCALFLLLAAPANATTPSIQAPDHDNIDYTAALEADNHRRGCASDVDLSFCGAGCTPEQQLSAYRKRIQEDCPVSDDTFDGPGRRGLKGFSRWRKLVASAKVTGKATPKRPATANGKTALQTVAIQPPSAIINKEMLVSEGMTEVYRAKSGQIALVVGIVNDAAPSRQQIDGIVEELMLDPGTQHVFVKNSGPSAVWRIDGQGVRITVTLVRAGYRATMTKKVLAQYIDFMMAHRDRVQTDEGWSQVSTPLLDITVRGVRADGPPTYSKDDAEPAPSYVGPEEGVAAPI